MTRTYTDAELEAFLDEALAATDMAEIEVQLRGDAPLMERLQTILGRRDAGIHSLGEIWREHRVSCPDRETLGSYLLNILDPNHQAYVKFHLEQIGCRVCQANLADLKTRQAEASASIQRQRRYFQSSAGYLKNAAP